MRKRCCETCEYWEVSYESEPEQWNRCQAMSDWHRVLGRTAYPKEDYDPVITAPQHSCSMWKRATKTIQERVAEQQREHEKYEVERREYEAGRERLRQVARDYIAEYGRKERPEHIAPNIWMQVLCEHPRVLSADEIADIHQRAAKLQAEYGEDEAVLEK